MATAVLEGTAVPVEPLLFRKINVLKSFCVKKECIYTEARLVARLKTTVFKI